MTDYINNIAVDLDIYNKWPEVISDKSIAYIPETAENPAQFWIVDSSDEFPEKTIVELEDFPKKDYYGKILWSNDGKKSPVVGLLLKDDYKNNGIGKFLCILTRTWVAEKFDSEIFSPEMFRSEEVEKILIDIALEYNEKTLILKTTTGEFKPFGEIENIEQELGI